MKRFRPTSLLDFVAYTVFVALLTVSVGVSRVGTAIADQVTVVVGALSQGGTIAGQLIVSGASNPLTVIATAVVSNAETIARFSVSDNANSAIGFVNVNATDATMAPELAGYAETGSNSGLAFLGGVLAANDSGSQPVTFVESTRATAWNTATALLTARPLFGLYNFTTLMAQWDVNGGWSNPGSSTCNGGIAGATCIPDDILGFSSTAGTGTQVFDLWNTTATNNASQINAFGNGTGQSTFNSYTGTPAAATQTALFGYVNSAQGDVDIQDKVNIIGLSKIIQLDRTDDVAVGSIHTEWRDLSSGTGVQLAVVYGDGHMKTNTAQVILPIYLGVAGAVLPVIATGIFGAAVLDQAFTLKKAKGRIRTAGTGGGNYVATVTDATNTCTFTFACTAGVNTTVDVTATNGAGTGCVYASGASLTISSTTDCTTPPQLTSFDIWGIPQ